jgi:nucleotide-binding universal stress UspA family protein
MIELRRILAPTDFSDHSTHALRYAVSLAERLGATLYLMHVLPEVVTPVGPEPMLLPTVPVEYYAETEKTSLESLRDALKPEWGTPPSVQAVVRWGDIVANIVSYAQEIEADLIVVATHGRSGLSHVLMGSVAERIVREAACPVLTVRDTQRS